MPTDEFVEDEEARLQRIVSQNLDFVTKRVEQFVDMAYTDFNILIFETYVFIDADAAFHILLLVSQADLISPHMIALKIQAKEQLTTDEEVSMRFQFTNSEEYARFHDTQRIYKLRYMYQHTRPIAVKPLILSCNGSVEDLSHKELLKIVATLPDAQREVFNLFVFENYSHKEIAEILNINQNNCRWHLNDARRRLKEKINALIK